MKAKFNRYRDAWEGDCESMHGAPTPAPSGEAAQEVRDFLTEFFPEVGHDWDRYICLLVDLPSKPGKVPTLIELLTAWGDRCRREGIADAPLIEAVIAKLRNVGNLHMEWCDKTEDDVRQILKEAFDGVE